VEAALDRRRTWAVNVGVARILADYVAATDGWMLYPSSDFIWDGTAEARYCEEDVPEPRTVYGHSKVAAERVVLDAGAGAVARFSLMYGTPRCPRDSTWVRIMAALQQGDVRIRFAADECQVVEDGAFILVLPEGRELVGVVRRWRTVTPNLQVLRPGGLAQPACSAFSTTVMAASSWICLRHCGREVPAHDALGQGGTAANRHQRRNRTAEGTRGRRHLLQPGNRRQVPRFNALAPG
jgi:dTDP-6-deoxy-L-lyxo-4-hexulose reductase RmlD-like protein